MVAPYAWLVGGEIPSQRLRSYTFGLAAAVGFFMAWLTQFTAPYFINPASLNWGPRYGYIWFPSAILTAVWVFWFLPEVKGRRLEEVDEMVSEPYCVIFGIIADGMIHFQFEAKLPARKFRKYVCVGPLGHIDEKAAVISTEEEVRARENEKVYCPIKCHTKLAM